MDFAHSYDRKIFLTVNTLLKNREIGRELYDYLKPLYLHGLDAIIVQDYGVFQFVRRNFPGLPVHASTQMSVANVHGAEFLKRRGAARIVTARELSLGEIRAIYEQTGVEIESFIHGALCYCYSGQCLMSSMLGGRSGNRGRCAQPCRLAYQVLDEKENVLHRQEKYPLSPKDLCTVTLLPKLCGAGIYSFKIEGRMKQLEYAAGVTQIYRKYLDMYEENPDAYHVEDKDLSYLLQLGSRNGFTTGYYEMRNGRDMMTLTDSSHSSGQAKNAYQPGEIKKKPICGEAVLKKGSPALLTIEGENTVSVSGAEVMEAQSRPLTEEEIRKRLFKTGDTPFVFESLKITLEDGVFLPVKQLNELRRDALAELQTKITEKYRRTLTGQEPDISEYSVREQAMEHRPFLNVQISSPKMLPKVLRYPFVDMVTLDFTDNLNRCREQIAAAGKRAGVCFPYIFRDNSVLQFENMESQIKDFDRIWVRSYDSLGYALDVWRVEPEKLALDHNLYVYSGEAAGAFAAEGLKNYTASLELNHKELRHMPNQNGEFLLYGYVPLMVSAQCVYKNYDRCYKSKKDAGRKLYIKDRYFKKFFIKRNCKDCYNIIYNSQPVFLFHQEEMIRKLEFASYRISFVKEDEKQMDRALHDYETAFVSGRQIAAPGEKEAFTNGHFRRGIE